MSETISFDHKKARALQRAHDTAAAANQSSFIFEGREYVTRYAYYLLEYLNSQWRDKE
jgi:hypothetical protein